MWAVGMHHHGARQLLIGEGYSLETEPDNKFDKCAVKIIDYRADGKVTKAYLKRDNAFVISKLFEIGVGTLWRLKPKEEPEVRQYRTRPQQRCNIGYKCRSDQQLDAACEVLKKYDIDFKVTEH